MLDMPFKRFAHLPFNPELAAGSGSSHYIIKILVGKAGGKFVLQPEVLNIFYVDGTDGNIVGQCCPSTNAQACIPGPATMALINLLWMCAYAI